MKDLLKIIMNVPGVLGCFLLNSEDKLQDHLMPDNYNNDILLEIISVSTISIKGCESTFQEISSLIFQFKNNFFYLKKFEQGILGILTSDIISMPVLNVTFNIFAKSLKDKKTDTIQENTNNSINESPISLGNKEFFNVLQKNLSSYIGPLSGIIIDEKLSELGINKSDFDQKSSLKLLNLLCKELDDPAQCTKFSKTMLVFMETLL